MNNNIKNLVEKQLAKKRYTINGNESLNSLRP
jgi:hypothetical protein